ncbi:hypothetical protein PUMCH_004479 [Australozyma saopauloensis]|uniref:Uncharacterized protein n=1 Tax=Australozyma saopauloensis TaxID=291208 RepID=A0AAX4HFC6_9ASCO|nr:hypothetical protein PUMCH_004479 [[Candida] saopauloensis]
MRCECRRLLGSDVLQLTLGVHEVVGILLPSEVSNLGLLNIETPALALGKTNSRILGVKLHDGALQSVCTTLVSHQVVLPTVALAQNVPVQLPEGGVVGTGLGGRLGLSEYTDHSFGGHFFGSTGDELFLQLQVHDGFLGQNRGRAQRADGRGSSEKASGEHGGGVKRR